MAQCWVDQPRFQSSSSFKWMRSDEAGVWDRTCWICSWIKQLWIVEMKRVGLIPHWILKYCLIPQHWTHSYADSLQFLSRCVNRKLRWQIRRIKKIMGCGRCFFWRSSFVFVDSCGQGHSWREKFKANLSRLHFFCKHVFVQSISWSILTCRKHVDVWSEVSMLVKRQRKSSVE